jgi:hypothetical protein
MAIKFSPPPESGRDAWPKRLEPLKERPGEWALVYKSPSTQAARSYADRLKRGKRYAVPPGFEFRGGKSNGQTGIWARFVGEQA